LALVTAVAYPAQETVSLHWGSASMGFLSGEEALAVSGCLSEAVTRSLSAAQSSALLLEIDLGDGWFTVR
jgi:hypothetical protein